MNLNSVKHVCIYGQQANNNCVNYFSNATELTIRHYFKKSENSISTTLNCMIPLTQLTKLVIESYGFPLKEIVKLLCFTSSLYILKLNFLSLNANNSKFIEQNESFQYVSNQNKIKKSSSS
ncbi:unnamed protein product [Rotaria sp. Silwood1]|nr:unnamed protein product [Rotaria sp. Silwood1]CAF1135829.1 unnamed protein product [Rotaria sp. Silwood1]CAF3473564.1 unnamed protein product [Rotaria sp. Silwood1]CAF3480544.1 unnamed protein product [Rotaria sp. Silwood1]CAF4618379.1 unnamed protein product [Rotaria sp. Silwood1]